MSHEWERHASPYEEMMESLHRVVDPLTGQPLVPPPKSDVFFCRKCGDVTLGDVGGPPVEGLPGFEECGVRIARGVMDQ